MFYSLSEHHFMKDLSSGFPNEAIYPISIGFAIGLAVTQGSRFVHFWLPSMM
jgi:hypothetical protein